jgi:hypothetical protein
MGGYFHDFAAVQRDALAVELSATQRELDAMRARAHHVAAHDPDPAAVGAALYILNGEEPRADKLRGMDQ